MASYVEERAGRDRLTMMAVHDWLAHLDGAPSLLPEYGYSLAAYLRDDLRSSELLRQWSYKVQGGSATAAALLYRHYLMYHMIREPLILEYPCHPLTLVMAAGYCQDRGFAESDEIVTWPELLTTQDLLINHLVICQPHLAVNLHNLADRLDITDCALQQGHDLLSSYQLGYFLHLVAVLLDYEARLHQTSPNPPQDLYRDTMELLGAVKGVLFPWRNSKVRH